MLACPNCGGSLKFNVSSQDVMCDSCGTHFNPYAVSDSSGAETDSDFDVTVFRCSQCGGEIYSTDDTIAGFCSYCGASNTLTGRLTRGMRPEFIIPFKKTKQECKDIYKAKIKRFFYAPDDMKSESGIDGFRGIYMPYWVYDIYIGGPFAARLSQTKRRGDYIITDHYSATGSVNDSYGGLSYDASSSFADDISGKIAPYSAEHIMNFTPSYLSGFYADSSDVPAELYSMDAMSIAADKTASNVRFEIPAMYAIDGGEQTVANQLRPQLTKTHSALFPVWFMSYRNKDRVAYATVNGETGKVTADIPISVKKFTLISLATAFVLFMIIDWILNITLTPATLVSLAAVIGVVIEWLASGEYKSIAMREERDTGKVYVERQRVLSQTRSFDDFEAGAAVEMPVYSTKSRTTVKKTKKKSSAVNMFLVIWCMAFFGPFLLMFGQVGMGDFGAKAVTVICAVVTLIFMLKDLRNYNKIDELRGHLPMSVVLLSALVICAAILVLAPASDIYYYAAVIVTLVGTLSTMVGMITHYNLLATRPLPQFATHKGGDDRA